MTYFNKFIDFITRHNLYENKSFIAISNKTTNIDYHNEEARNFIGCFYKVENEIITDFKVCVPKIIDEKTLLINIHEYIHALIIYNSLGKKEDIGLEKETLPMMYEEMYAVESEEISIKKYLKEQQEMINEMNSDEYTIGSKIKDEIIYLYSDLETQLKYAKKLAKTYKK
jgi:hypothetical protein